MKRKEDSFLYVVTMHFINSVIDDLMGRKKGEKRGNSLNNNTKGIYGIIELIVIFFIVLIWFVGKKIFG